MKAHTLYDVKTDVPAFVIVTDASVHDSQAMGDIPYETDAIYIFARAYMVTGQLYAIAIRRIIYYDSICNRTFVFYTNNTDLSLPRT